MAQVAGNPAVVPAPPATPNPGQAENAPAKETGAGRPSKPKHPDVEKGIKLRAVPADASKYAGLREDDFEDSALDKFYDYQASQLESKAKKFRNHAERFRRMGCLPDKKVGKKLSALVDQIAEMYNKLACDGVPIELCNQVRKNSGLAEWSIDDYNKIRVDAGLPPIGTKAA